jgi:catechol-2,3-dioxygenase
MTAHNANQWTDAGLARVFAAVKAEPKHTPGPWEADIAEACYVRDAEGNQIAIFTHLNTKTGGRRHSDVVAANTRLAGAAPDLLETMQAFLEHDDAWERESRDSRISAERADEYLAKFLELKDKARAAIAKALGEQQ